MLKNYLSRSIACVAFLFAVSASADFYVVTNPDNKEPIDIESAKSLFNGAKTQWGNGKKVLLVMPELDTPDGEAALKDIYGFSREKYKKFWLTKVYRAEAAAPPETKSPDAIKAFLKSYPDAVSVLSSDQIDATVRKAFKLE